MTSCAMGWAMQHSTKKEMAEFRGHLWKNRRIESQLICRLPIHVPMMLTERMEMTAKNSANSFLSRGSLL